ncbi:MAG: hypothetical protein WB767_14615, partial [Nocardioides sp.]
MALFSRSASSAEAVYARSIDGEHLWLAVRGEGPLVLRGGGREIEVPHEVDGDLLVAVFPLTAALSDLEGDLELRLLAGRRAAAVGAPPPTSPGPGLETPASSDGRWQLHVTSDDGEVVVRRSRRDVAAAAIAFRVSD